MLSWGQGGQSHSISGSLKTSVLSTNTKSKFATVVLKGVLCPELDTPVILSLQLRRRVRGEVRALEGHCVSSKSPSMVQDGDEGVMGGVEENSVSLKKGSLICPPEQKSRIL